jgi:hypothetical protein
MIKLAHCEIFWMFWNELYFYCATNVDLCSLSAYIVYGKSVYMYFVLCSFWKSKSSVPKSGSAPAKLSQGALTPHERCPATSMTLMSSWPLCQKPKMVLVPFSRSHPKSLVCMPCQHTNIPVNVPINQACQVSPWALHIPAILSCPLFRKPSKPEVMAPMPFDRVLMPTGNQASSNWVWALHSFLPHFFYSP